jgi:adenosine deaminase
VRNAGLQATIHAGEAGGAKSVWQAITELGATRIGHGVASIEDEKLMTYMVNNNIAIESCLTSNFQTGTVKNLSQHPLKEFLDFGIKACLNTDDPAVQGIEIKHEFDVAQQTLKLTDNEISQLQKNAIEVSFLSNNDKNTLLTNKKIV